MEERRGPNNRVWSFFSPLSHWSICDQRLPFGWSRSSKTTFSTFCKILSMFLLCAPEKDAPSCASRIQRRLCAKSDHLSTRRLSWISRWLLWETYRFLGQLSSHTVCKVDLIGLIFYSRRDLCRGGLLLSQTLQSKWNRRFFPRKSSPCVSFFFLLMTMILSKFLAVQFVR